MLIEILLVVSLCTMLVYGYVMTFVLGRPNIGHLILAASLVFYLPIVIGVGPDYMDNALIVYGRETSLFVMLCWLATFAVVMFHDYFAGKWHIGTGGEDRCDDYRTFPRITYYIVIIIALLIIGTLVKEHLRNDLLVTHKRDVDFLLSPQLVAIGICIAACVAIYVRGWVLLLALLLFGVYCAIWFQIRTPGLFIAIACLLASIHWPLTRQQSLKVRLLYNHAVGAVAVVYMMLIGISGTIRAIVRRATAEGRSWSETIAGHRGAKLASEDTQQGVYKFETLLQERLIGAEEGIWADVIQVGIYVGARFEAFVNSYILNTVIGRGYQVDTWTWITQVRAVVPFHESMTGERDRYWFNGLADEIGSELYAGTYNLASSLYGEVFAVGGFNGGLILISVIVGLLMAMDYFLVKRTNLWMIGYFVLVPILGFFLFRTPIVACLALSVLAVLGCVALGAVAVFEQKKLATRFGEVGG